MSALIDLPFVFDEAASDAEAARVEALLTAPAVEARGEEVAGEPDVLLADMADRLPDTALAGDELVASFRATEDKRVTVESVIREMYPAVRARCSRRCEGGSAGRSS